MTEVFDRVYNLAIGRNSSAVEKTIPQLLVRAGEGVPQLLAKNTYSDFNTEPNEAMIITDLRITANIVYTKEGKTNKQNSTIEIYNLSKDHQAFIKTDDTVLLKAGYRNIDGDNPPLIFSGQVKTVRTERRGPDFVTKIVCSAITTPRKNIRFSKNPVRNETNEDVIKYLVNVAAANGLPTGFVFVPDRVTYPSGMPLHGRLLPTLEEFCNRFNLACYVVLGRLYVEPKAVTSPAKPKVIVTAENVKGSIGKEDDSSGTSASNDPKNISGIKFNTFLNGNITPAAFVEVTYGEYEGKYSVVGVGHKLDSEGKDWDTIVSGKRIII